MPNKTIELETKSFYGSMTKSSKLRQPGIYSMPLEQKIKKDKILKSNVRSLPEATGPLRKRQKSSKQKENSISSKNFKKTSCGTFLFKEGKSDNVARSPHNIKSHVSPTINWKPNSLQDKYLRMSKTKYANMAKKANGEKAGAKGKPPNYLVPVSQNTNNNRGEREVSDPDEHFQFSVQSPPITTIQTSMQGKNSSEELKTSQGSASSGDSGVRVEEVELAESTTTCDTEKRIHPIFSPQTNQKNTTKRKSMRLLGKINIDDLLAESSPSAKVISLPGTAKSRQCVSPTSNSPASKQLIIDAGQKAFGANQCKVCGMVYTVNHPEDQQMHKIHHNRFVSCIKFPGWKKERVVSTFMNGRILKVLSSDPRFALKKVEEIGAVIDSELGFNQVSVSSNFRPLVTYLYISDDNQIAGCMICEPINQAYRVLPCEHDAAPLSCETEPRPATCGISRIWTCNRFRRQGIATRLCDVMRRSFVIGSQLELDQIAFSHPSPAGRSFAVKYCQTQQFLTYNFVL